MSGATANHDKHEAGQGDAANQFASGRRPNVRSPAVGSWNIAPINVEIESNGIIDKGLHARRIATMTRSIHRKTFMDIPFYLFTSL